MLGFEYAATISVIVVLLVWLIGNCKLCSRLSLEVLSFRQIDNESGLKMVCKLVCGWFVHFLLTASSARDGCLVSFGVYAAGAVSW